MKGNIEKSMSFTKSMIAVGYLTIALTYTLRFLHDDPHIPLATAALLCGRLSGSILLSMRRLPF
jgi:hypothetical protein